MTQRWRFCSPWIKAKGLKPHLNIASFVMKIFKRGVPNLTADMFGKWVQERSL